ncbi:MAG: right-handed parallel beta-helix repeat-containing protein [Planctomycetota bacterium]
MNSKLLNLSLILICVFVGLTLADSEGPPLAEFQDGTSIELDPADPNWEAVVSDYNDWHNDLHALQGYHLTDPNASVKWSSDSGYGLDYYACAGGAGKYGFIIYKFTTPANYKFHSGTVDCDAFFYGCPSTQGAPAWFGVGTSVAYDNYGLTVACANDYDKEQITDGNWLPDPPYTYYMDWSLDIPNDTNTFYVVVSDSRGDGTDSTSSGTIGYDWMYVDANVVGFEGPPLAAFTDGAEIQITAQTTAWSATMTDFNSWHNDLHALKGAIQGSNWQDCNASVQWRNNGGYYMNHGAIAGIESAGECGYIVYKFVRPDGGVFSGGTIDANVLFVGNPTTQGAPVWFGVGTSVAYDNYGLTVACANGYDKSQFLEPNIGDIYWEKREVNIPEDVNVFYVVFSDSRGDGTDSTSSAKIGYDSLNVSALFVSGPPITSFTNGSSVELTVNDANWEADMTTYNKWFQNLHAVKGKVYGEEDPNASVQWRNDGGGLSILEDCNEGITHGAIAGATYGDGRGTIIYKFTTPAGYWFESGTVDANLMLNGQPATQGEPAWFGVGTYVEYGTYGLVQECANSFDQTHILEGNDWTVYKVNREVNIPANVDKFYVVISDSQGSGENNTSSARFGYNSLRVNSTVGEANYVGPPLASFQDGAEIELTVADPNYNAAMTDYWDWHDDLHALKGRVGDTTDPNASVQWRKDGQYSIDHGAIAGADESNDMGFVIYKFACPNGYAFDSGKITADVMFYGTPATDGNRAWFGAGDSIEYDTYGLTQECVNYFEKSQFLTDSDPNLYTDQRDINIPEGTNAFYVVVADSLGNGDGNSSSGMFGYDSLAVCPSIISVPDTIYADEWGPGWDSNDATECLQRAIDVGANTVVVRDMGSDWYIRPIFLNSDNQTIQFDANVVVTAKPGEFKATNDCLFSAENKTGIVLTGYDATLQMQKDDYLDANQYQADPANRHTLAFWSCKDIQIYGLTTKDSGGDGIYLGEKSAYERRCCEDVNIVDVVCDNHYRQGISVSSAKNLTVKGCTFSNTIGTAPSAGIDFESNNEYNSLQNIVISDCNFVDNDAFGVLFVMGREIYDISITIEDCHIDGSDALGIGVFNIADTDANGEVVIRNCTIEDTAKAGILLRDKSSYKCHFSLQDCDFINVGRGAPFSELEGTVDYPNHPMSIECYSGHYTLDVGGVDFNDCRVEDDVNRAFLYATALTQYHGLYDMQGEVYVDNPNGVFMDIGGPNDWTDVNIIYYAMPGKATGTDPNNGQTGVATDANLSWTAGYDANSHDIYIGTDTDAVADANHSSSEFMKNQITTTYEPNSLDADTVYYWRIDEVGGGTNNTTKGDVWNFTTAP